MPPARPVADVATKTTQDVIDVGQLLGACIDAAQRACKVIQEVQRAREQGISIGETYKDVSDPRSALTVADELAQAAILRPLIRDFPSLKVVAEEDVTDGYFKVHDDSPPLDFHCNELDTPSHLRNVSMTDVCVFCDPVDGTLEFVKGNLDAVQTLIGISVKGTAVAGVMGRPFVEGGIIYGIVGAGVVNLPPQPAPRASGSGLTLAVSRTTKSALLNDVIGEINASQRLALGAAGNKLLQVATGNADVCVLNLITSLWDTAATEAVIVAMGGKVTDLFGNSIRHSADARICNRYGLIASSALLSEHDRHERTHDAICQQLRNSMVLDSLLLDTGLLAHGKPQATDIALDIDGNPITAAWLSSIVGRKVQNFCAPESSAVRYLMSDACRIHLSYAEPPVNDPKYPKSIFLKRIVMAELEHVKLKAATAPQKLARDVTSYQVEAAFLASKGCRQLGLSGTSVAKPFFVDSRPAAVGAPPIESRFFLLLEDYSPEDGWAQVGLLDEQKLRCALDSLAALHAFFWDYSSNADYEELSESVWGQATYWLPSRQAKDSFEKLPRCWENLRSNFKEHLQTLCTDNLSSVSVNNVGEILAKHAPACADRVHGVGLKKDHPHRTIIHGDAKAANFFFKPRELREEDLPNTKFTAWHVGLIDFQWCGWGHPAIDLAYIMTSSASPDLLASDGVMEAKLLRAYYDSFNNYLVEFGKVKNVEEAHNCMSFHDLVSFYEDSIIDLARLVISYHWDRIGASPSVLKSRENQLGSNSYNKNIDCAMWLVSRVLSLLDKVETKTN